MLTQEQIERYRTDGYLLIEKAIDDSLLEEVRSEVERICVRARTMRENDELVELAEGHSHTTPKLQRIKTPHKLPFFRRWLERSGLLPIAAGLIGPNMRLHSSKINMKAAADGAAVYWHQDWAFYPHTNEDILAIGIALDDVGDDNAPLMMFPGTHKGPVYDHHGSAGYFIGGVDLAANGLSVDDAVMLCGPAGSVSFHHVRTLHGSGVNSSGRDRRLLLFELTAADAWPLAGTYSPFEDLEEYNDRMVAGDPCIEPRMESLPVRVPQPKPPVIASIYEIQKSIQEEERARLEVRQPKRKV